MTTTRAAPPITEKQWMAQVVDLARILHWETYHAWLSIHSPRGWPDLAIVRPPRLILAELKGEKGKLTAAQVHWLELLSQCPGVEVFVWRPTDLDNVTRVLR
ncbi:MAG TPA: VRR-NUC domain-containing protein [Acidimicrobiales bacterium]|nr:VRR-NUC domain-containing protein [Acidimicrobiales bacterium]